MEELLLKDQKKSQIGFLGVGWIGFNRMESALASGKIRVAGIADKLTDQVDRACEKCEADVARCEELDELIALEPDGVVIATPSAMHAAQSLAALRKGIAVFCQKPLGRNAAETRKIVETAKAKDLLLGVDFSYRYTCFRLLHQIIQRGEIGKIYSMELCFHNAYGPDKDWFYQKASSGGGCIMDLGVHLIDLAIWCLNDEIMVSEASLYANGQHIHSDFDGVEDHAMVTLNTSSGCTIQLNCSWNLPAGKEAELFCNIYGTDGGLSFRNINGSFYDFEALRFRGIQTERLFGGADDWGGRAIAEWCTRLSAGEGFNSEVERVVQVAELIDEIYEKA